MVVFPWLILASQFVTQNFDNPRCPGLREYQRLVVSSIGTTDSRDVVKFLALPGKKVILSTYRSLGVLLEALEATRASPGIALFEEAHHMSEENATAQVDKVAELSSRAFYFTATPSQAIRMNIGNDTLCLRQRRRRASGGARPKTKHILCGELGGALWAVQA